MKNILIFAAIFSLGITNAEEPRKITKFEQIQNFEDLQAFVATKSDYDAKLTAISKYLDKHGLDTEEALTKFNTYVDTIAAAIVSDQKMKPTLKEKLTDKATYINAQAKMKVIGKDAGKTIANAWGGFSRWIQKKADEQAGSQASAPKIENADTNAPVKDNSK